MQLQVGEQRLLVCGVLSRVAPYEAQVDKGIDAGFSGQVDFMGGATKFSCDASAHHILKPFIGKVVQLVGVPKVAGDRGERGTLKIGKLLQASSEGKQVYANGADENVADAPKRPGIFGGGRAAA